VNKPATDRVVIATVRDSSADETGTAGQTAVAVRDDPRNAATIVAIAGGRRTRGSRSHIGARIAADVAATKAEAAVAALPSTDAAALAPLGDMLAARIVEQWQAQVRDHAVALPAAGDEAAVDDDTGGEDTDALSVYGTALLLAIVTPSAVLALQLGAGELVLRSDDGEALRPLAGDAAGDREADSLALADAQSRFRHAAVDRTAGDIALVLGAVGLDSAVADAQWLATLAADLDTQAADHGIDSVEEQLPGRLADMADGDGQDVTVALVFPATGASAVPAEDVTDPRFAATIANPAVAAAAAATAATALTTSEIPAVTAPANPRRRRAWLMAAVTAGVALLAIGFVLALSRDKGSSTPATTVTTTRATSTTMPTSTSTSPPSSVAPSSAPSTASPPTTLPVVVTVPTTAAPPRTTTAPPPPPVTTAAPPTTVPVTPSSPPTT
jgi:protein phosphatase 2C-like protein